MKIFLSCLFFISFSLGAQVSFQHGETYEADSREGWARAMCGQDRRNIYCVEETLSPTVTSFLTTQEKIAAEKVEMVARHEDGSTEDKTEKWYSEENKSSRVNLWITTLFQKPLLEKGLNQIETKFLKDGEVVRNESFQVDVTEGRNLNCRAGTVIVQSRHQCHRAEICGRYFSRYCQF